MESIIEGIGALGVVALLVLGLLTILLPLSVYSAQKYAYKCFVELKGVNERLDLLRKSVSYLAEVEQKKLSAGKVREAGQ